MAEEEFVRAVEDGLKMAKRVYAGKDRQIAAAPRRAVGMARSADSFIPSAPMVYAVISDPAVVDNPDIPSYQPHVYGRCDPPALIPLHMGNIVLEVDCLLDSAFVSVSGQWRVHCVMRNKTCDCRLVVPMGEQVYANHLSGGLLLKSPTTHDDDQRDMFCFYVFPGNDKKRKSFKKEIVFVVDVSGSMQGKLIENVKSALAASLLELHPGDLFDIIAFNDELYSFSQCLEHATEDRIESAIQWMDTKFIADGGTDIMHSLKEAIGLLSSTKNSLPQIFLITDGAVEDERNIYRTIRTYLANSGSLSPRISTFGIGSYSNHYFLKMLASIGRGQYDAAYDADSIGTRIQKWFNRASSTIVANLMVDISSDFDEFEVKKLSIQNNTPSEYTCIVLLQNDNGKEAVKQVKKQKSPKHAGQGRVLPAVVRGGGSIGFGDTKATLENRRLGEPTEPETFAIFNKATGCCNMLTAVAAPAA